MQALTFIDPVEFLGRWVVLSFVPSLEEFDMDLWDAQGRNLQTFGAALLLVPLEARGLHSVVPFGRKRAFHDCWRSAGEAPASLWDSNAAVLGTRTNISVDPDGRLRFHVLHSLSDRGMGVIMELLQAYQGAEIPVLV